jgi:SH3-like domain-containing protein
MRGTAPVIKPVALLLMSSLALTPLQGLAQQGSLQPPSYKPAEIPPPRPDMASGAAQHRVSSEHATPVIHPHGPVHPARPGDAQQPPRPLPLPPALPLPNADSSAAPSGGVAGPVPPERQDEPEKPANTGLPLPRFAALRSDDVNLRAGPGTRYPIEWIYKRRDLPMEIEREFEVWRLVKDPDGIRGWVHQATLTGRRTFIVEGEDATLRAEPRDDAGPVAVLKIGVIGRIRSCEAGSDWCRMQVGEYRGFLKRSEFWGALPGENIAP